MRDSHDWKERLNSLQSLLVEESISAEELSELPLGDEAIG